MLHNERSKHSILVALFSIFLNFKAAKIELFFVRVLIAIGL